MGNLEFSLHRLPHHLPHWAWYFLWLWTLTLAITSQSLTVEYWPRSGSGTFRSFAVIGKVSRLFHYPLNIISVSFQLCPLGHVDFKVQPPLSILRHPPPHISGGLGKADAWSHLSHGHHLWKLCAVWNLPLSTREGSLWCPECWLQGVIEIEEAACRQGTPL